MNDLSPLQLAVKVRINALFFSQSEDFIFFILNTVDNTI